MKEKVIIVGIDGATFNLLNPWMRAGFLPYFAKIVAKGVAVPLISTIPPMTVPAWTSLSTGQNPGKHGAFDFYYREGYQKKVIDSQAVKSKHLWQILSEAGKKVIVINPPVSYPPHKVNGFFIAGMLTPSYESDYTYPRSLKKKLKVWDYRIGIELDPGARSHFARSFVFCQDKRKLKKLVDYFDQIAWKRFQVFKKLARQIDWAFAFILFEGADRLSHYYWQEERLFVIKKHYQILDKILGELLELIGKQGRLIIVSDHGFGKIEKKFYLNNFLNAQGWLTPKKSEFISETILKKGKELIEVLARLGFPQEQLLRNKWVFRLYQKIYRPSIDFSRTKAFMFTETSRGIWLNVKGREPNGVVLPSDYERLRRLIIRQLRSLRDPVNGKPIIKALRREEVYQGNYLDQAPDILLITYPGYSLEVVMEGETGRLAKNNFLKETSLGERNADHEMEGVLMIVGPGVKIVKKRTSKNNPRIIDIAPTVLKLFKTSTPVSMDGRVLKEFFS